MKPNLMELNIEKVSSDGSGIARSDGGVVFVSGALPGETVEAEITKRKKDFALARVARVKKPHPHRITPVCTVFGSCGGCQLQHASYELQLEIKADILRDALSRIGGFDLREGELSRIECVPSPQEWGYRNKASFPIRRIKGKPAAGFYQAGSHRLVQLTSCPVNAAPLNRLFALVQNELPNLSLDVYDEREHRGALRHLILRAGLHTKETLVSLVINGRLNTAKMKSLTGLCRTLKEATTVTLNHNSRPGNVILGERTEALRGTGLITELLDEWTLRYDTTSFFQVNTEQSTRLYRHVQDLARGSESVLELYSGVGSLTGYLSNAKTVTSVEEWGNAVELMKENLKNNDITNITPLCGKAEEVMIGLNGGYDLVVPDPPRSGCERVVLEKMLEFGPERILYVSCNPATLARDAKILSEGSCGVKYKLKSVRAFDMFPQTVHVETVLLLERER